jgi:FSR family fosmidomycin resistance protein-like MFS transporter
VTKFGLTLAMAGLLGTSLSLTSSFTQLFFGTISDRMSRPYLTAIGPPVTATMMALVGVVPSYSWLLVVLAICGLGTACFHPQSFALAGAFSRDRRGTGLAFFITGGELGYALGPLAAVAVVGAAGLDGTVFTAVPALAACVFVWMNLRTWQMPASGRPRDLRADFGPRGRAFALLWIAVVIRSIITVAHIIFLPLLMQQRGQSLLAGGVAVLAFGGIGALGGLTGGWLSDRIGRRAVMTISFVVGAPMLLLFNKMPGPWSLVPLALGGFGLYLGASVSVVMAQEIVPMRTGLATSLVTGVAWGTSGLMLAPIGAIADRITLAATMPLLLALTIPALIATALIPRPSEEHPG